jgi:hypothetical protein
VLALRSSSVLIKVSQRGTFDVALRYTPYWSAPGVCINATSDGMIALHTPHPGSYLLTFSLTASGALAALSGSENSCPQHATTGAPAR